MLFTKDVCRYALTFEQDILQKRILLKSARVAQRTPTVVPVNWRLSDTQGQIEWAQEWPHPYQNYQIPNSPSSPTPSSLSEGSGSGVFRPRSLRPGGQSS